MFRQQMLWFFLFTIPHLAITVIVMAYHKFSSESWVPSTGYHIASSGILLIVFLWVGRKYLRYLSSDHRNSMKILRTVILVSLLVSSFSLLLRLIYNVLLFCFLAEANKEHQAEETVTYLLLLVGAEVLPYCSHMGTYLYKRKRMRELEADDSLKSALQHLVATKRTLPPPSTANMVTYLHTHSTF